MALEELESNNAVVCLNDGGDGDNNRDGFIDSSKNLRNPQLDPNGNGVLGSESCSVGKRIKLSTVSDQWRISEHEGDLVTKCYYAKRKIVWEVLEGALKSKIEIQWSDIEAIRATTRKDELGILEIQLNQPPLFFREINPQPRKHTLWQQGSDFTGGQAPIYRRHYVEFLPGTLDKHYDKLLQCDRRLADLNRKPFPTLESPYFYGGGGGGGGGISLDPSFRFRICPSPISRAHCHSFAPISSPSSIPDLHSVRRLNPSLKQPTGLLNSNPLISDIYFLRRNQAVGNYGFDNQVAPAIQWGQEGNNFQNVYYDYGREEDQIQGQDGNNFQNVYYDHGREGDQIQGQPPSIPPATLATPSFIDSEMVSDPTTVTLSDIKNHLLGDSFFAGSDNRNLSNIRFLPSPPLEHFQEGNSSGLAIGGTDRFGYETENFYDGGAGRIYPQSIRSLPPHISGENPVMMMPHLAGRGGNGEYPLLELAVDDYEDGANHDVYQWP
ncbi:hypothetical protein U1Q18_035713 [Sarracenia purpurea var. burkii]